MSDRGEALNVEPRASVVMNCLNGETFLREALDSVLTQDIKRYEVVFWDNGSTDGTLDIVREYMASDPRLRLVRNPGETVPLGHARAAAMDECRADLVAFLDVDDVWEPDTLSRLVALLDQDPELGGVYAGTVEIDRDGNVLRRRSPPLASGNLLPHLLREFDVYIPAMLLRKSVLQRHGLGFDPAIHASEEVCLWLQLAVHCKLASHPDPVARYRVHGGTLTASAIGRWASERSYALEKVAERDPTIAQRYAAEWAEAHARARFYQARYYMALGRRADARREMAGVKFQDHRYFALYLAMFLPSATWRTLLMWRTGRPEPFLRAVDAAS